MTTGRLIPPSAHPPRPRLEIIHSPHLLDKNIRIQRGHQLNVTRARPSLHWTSNTQMICLRQRITETKESVYARASCRQDASRRRKSRHSNGSQLALFRAFKCGSPLKQEMHPHSGASYLVDASSIRSESSIKNKNIKMRVNTNIDIVTLWFQITSVTDKAKSWLRKTNVIQKARLFVGIKNKLA